MVAPPHIIAATLIVCSTLCLRAISAGECEVNEVANMRAPSPEPWDLFGSIVSINASRGLVGARGEDDDGSDAGAAYVLTLDGAEWFMDTRLTASDPNPWDGFGNSVSISQNGALVGAFNVGNSGAGAFDGGGAVYFFRCITGVWMLEAKLQPSNVAPAYWFGSYITQYDRVALITAVGGVAAHVYRFDGLAWKEEAKLSPSDSPSGKGFGNSASLHNDTAMIGAHLTDDNGENSGAVYVYQFDGSSWIETAKLTASDAAAGDRFGVAVSLDGDVAVVGALGADDNGFGSGAAYVFRHNGDSWLEEAKLTPADGAANDGFGISVQIEGEMIAIGAWGTTHGTNPGAVYVFKLDGMGWQEEAKLNPSDSQTALLFGNSISLHEGHLLVGAMGHTEGGVRSGAAYLYQGLTDCNGNGALDVCDIVSGLADDCNMNAVPDSCDVAEGASTDCNGNGTPDECEDEALSCFALDIKPGSCPNSFNRGSHGVLPVGLLGTGGFDVTQVDMSSVVLSRADGVGGSVGPNEGPPGPHSEFEDVGTPFDGDLCNCHEATTDGVTDLSMKFKTDDLVAALEMDGLAAGALVELTLSGELLDGTPFEASDCVRLVPPAMPPGQLTVTIVGSGQWVDVSPIRPSTRWWWIRIV